MLLEGYFLKCFGPIPKQLLAKGSKRRDVLKESVTTF